MLELNNLSVIFNEGTVNEKLALDNINLTLDPGDFVTIIGSNGAGKSTLFQAISGAVDTKSGSIILNGKDITFEPEYRRSRVIGRLFQDPLKGTAPNMTIEENLHLSNQRGKHFSLNLMSHRHRENFKEALKELDLGLEKRLDTKVGLLSGGQRQAMALVMSTMTPIEFLILDEHTAALDPKTAELIMELTDSIVKEKNLTAIMVTHNLRYAMESGNRLLMMHQGEVILDKKGAEKSGMTVENVLGLFNEISIECGN